MNQLIQALLQRATEYQSNGDDTESPVINQEKFAKLIVQECIDKIGENFVGAIGTHASAHNSAVLKCQSVLKEHFDIKK